MLNKKIIGLLILATTLVGCGNSSEVSSETPSASSELPSSVSSSSSSEASSLDPSIYVPTSETTPAPAYTGNYYDSVNLELTGTDLKNALYARIRNGFTNITYSAAWNAVKEMDQDNHNSNNVITIYARRSMSKSQTGSSGNVWNREHSYPQSKLGKDASAGTANIASDVANLFAADAEMNSTRSNYSYNNVTFSRPTYLTDATGQKTDNKMYSGNFEPTDLAKGEIARANLYMMLMYPVDCTLNENGPIEALLEWNRDFGPNVERDLQRQAGIYKYQNNRNPFIDHPELACKIWGDTNKNTRTVCGIA